MTTAARPAVSPTMQLAIDAATAHGGELERWPGGFWTFPGCAKQAHNGWPTWSVGASTVNALIARDLVEVTERAGRVLFPVRVRLK